MSIAAMNSPVVENLQRLISASGVKQKVIAERVGYTAQELSDIIAGRRLIKIRDIPVFSAALGVDVNALFQNVQNSKEDSPYE